MNHYEIVIVGAGLAGLIAARDLLRAGHKVIVVEAKDRVGGRTWSVPFDAAGCLVDLGAEWVAPDHHIAVANELRAYNLVLEEPPLLPTPRKTGVTPTPSVPLGQLLDRCNRVA
jgi:monoamine oxidase